VTARTLPPYYRMFHKMFAGHITLLLTVTDKDALHLNLILGLYLSCFLKCTETKVMDEVEVIRIIKKFPSCMECKS